MASLLEYASRAAYRLQLPRKPGPGPSQGVQDRFEVFSGPLFGSGMSDSVEERCMCAMCRRVILSVYLHGIELTVKLFVQHLQSRKEHYCPA